MSWNYNRCFTVKWWHESHDGILIFDYYIVRRNIKRTLTGLNIVSFTDSSLSPVRRRIVLETAHSNDESIQRVEREEGSTRLLAQDIHDEINQVDVMNTPTSFDFHTKRLSESES